MAERRPNFLHPGDADLPWTNVYNVVGGLFLVAATILFTIGVISFGVGYDFDIYAIIAAIFFTGGLIFFGLGLLAADLQQVHGAPGDAAPVDAETGADTETQVSDP
jgi:hypothetical protein